MSTTHPRRRGRAGRFWLYLTTAVCVLIGGYGVALVASGFTLVPVNVAGNAFAWAVQAHITGASLALLLLPWQLWPGIRRHPRIHRWIGRSYVVSALVGGLSGIAAAAGTTAGPVAATGFGALGIVWVLTTVAMWANARRGRVAHHRWWAVLSFAMAFAAVTLRIELPLLALAFGFETAYVVVAWLCWVPNLLLARHYLSRISRPRRPVVAPSAMSPALAPDPS